jgi:serine/threonine-protein kinase PpkA
MKIPGYNIESQIGTGGMAVVYRAIQESLGRPVALKVMHPLFADSPEFTERFLNEGRLLASLRHSHIMTIYDIGVSDGLHYISMEYVDGGDLRQRIGHGMPLQTALDYVITLGSCLKAAHAAQVVHRDVKPANILFRTDGTLLLTDFGIAKHLRQHHGLTTTGSMIGSPYYLSPEQALGRAVDGKADIYSLGIVFYEMLVGEKPFGGDSEVEVALQHLKDQLPPLPQHLSHVQPLLERMTAKEPADRFHDAASMLHAAQCLRDTERWDSAETVLPAFKPGSATVPRGSAASKPGQTSSAGGMLPMDLHNTAGHFGSPFRNVPVGKRGTLLVGAGVFALAVGMLAGRLVGSKDDVIPTVGTGSTRAWTAVPARMHPQALLDPPTPMDVPPSLDAPASMGMLAVTDTLPLADPQVSIGMPAEVTVQPPMDRPDPLNPPAPKVPSALLDELLRAAHTALSDYRLTTPDTDSAYYYYQQVLVLDPENSQATAGFSLIAERYLELATKAFEKGQEQKAEKYVTLGLSIKNDHPELLAFHHRLTSPERHGSGRDETRTTGNSGTRNEPTGPENMGASVGTFFRNVTRMFAAGASQAPRDTADPQFPRRDGD